MDFDYKYFHSVNRTMKIEKFSNKRFKLSSFIIFIEEFDDNSHNAHYIIEFKNAKNEIGVLEISLRETWRSIKNHFKVGIEVIANGKFHYDENEKLTFIEIDSFYYNGICVSKSEISSREGKTSIRRNLLKDKPIMTMLIIWIVSLFLMKISVKIFGIVFLINTIIIAIYVTIMNKKLGINSDIIASSSS